MKLRKNQLGFSPVEIILIIAVVGLLGLAGWLFYDRQNNTKSESTLSQSTQSSADETNNENSSEINTSSQEDPRYLSIEEWGIKLKLSNATADAYYQTGEVNSGTVFLSVESLRDTDCNANNGAGGGFLIRFKEGAFNSETKRAYTSEYPTAIKIDTYYYGYGINPAYETCSTNISVQKKADTIRAKFEEALKSLVKT